MPRKKRAGNGRTKVNKKMDILKKGYSRFCNQNQYSTLALTNSFVVWRINGDQARATGRNSFEDCLYIEDIRHQVRRSAGHHLDKIRADADLARA